MTPEATPIRVLVADDHPLLRAGVRKLIDRQPDMTVVAEAGDGDAAVAAYRACRPDVTLMDLQMPTLDGTAATREIRREFPAARIVMLTTYRGDVQVHDALAAGAVGYVLKDTARKALADAVRAAHAGRRVIPAEIAGELASHLLDERLTARELDVLRGIASGLSNRGCAEHLAITEDTVKSHMRSILAKLAANDRTHAVAIAVKRGLIVL